MEKRLTFAYGRSLILSRFIVFGSLLLLVAVVGAALPKLTLEMLLLPVVLLAAYFLLFAVSPLLTDHWLTRSRLILRQGWYFRAVIPLSEMESVRAVDETGPGRAPLGIHRPLGQATLYVTGARTGLVSVRLTQPRRFWQAFGLQASDLIFDVAQPIRFLAAIDERRGLLAPVEADRADA